MSDETKNGYTFWEEQASNSSSEQSSIQPQTTTQELTPTTITPVPKEDFSEQQSQDAWDNPNGYQQTYTGYSNGAIPVEPPKKKKKGSKKFLAFVGKAALFGFVAGGVFLGFNKIYYHFNPNALPSLQQSNIEYGNDSLQIPNQNTTLSVTKVMKDVDTSYTDVSAIVEKTLPATVSITSKFVSNNYFYGSYTQEGGGSGIIIGENDKEYLIATNDHVVDKASSISVSFIDTTSAEAYIKGSDPSSDSATEEPARNM